MIAMMRTIEVTFRVDFSAVSPNEVPPMDYVREQIGDGMADFMSWSEPETAAFRPLYWMEFYATPLTMQALGSAMEESGVTVLPARAGDWYLLFALREGTLANWIQPGSAINEVIR